MTLIVFDLSRLVSRAGRETPTGIDHVDVQSRKDSPPGQDEKHRRPIVTAATLADAVILNSGVTRDAFQSHLDRAGRAPPVLVAPFGVDLPAIAATGPPRYAAPSF